MEIPTEVKRQVLVKIMTFVKGPPVTDVQAKVHQLWSEPVTLIETIGKPQTCLSQQLA